MNIEWWKYVPGYEGLYEVSTEGRVRNSSTQITQTSYAKLLKQTIIDEVKDIFR